MGYEMVAKSQMEAAKEIREFMGNKFVELQQAAAAPPSPASPAPVSPIAGIKLEDFVIYKSPLSPMLYYEAACFAGYTSEPNFKTPEKYIVECVRLGFDHNMYKLKIVKDACSKDGKFSQAKLDGAVIDGIKCWAKNNGVTFHGVKQVDTLAAIAGLARRQIGEQRFVVLFFLTQERRKS
jgi:hypothetical protein